MAPPRTGWCSDCRKWKPLRAGRCPACLIKSRFADGGEAKTLPLASVVLASPLKVRCLAHAGFGAARIAELLAADEADVRRVLEEAGR